MSNQQENVQYTREVLTKMNDSQLNEMISYLKNKIESGRKEGKNTHQDEVEFCYLQDEFFRRSKWNKNRARGRNTRAEAVRPRRFNKNNNR